jgi:hypothetical protein
VAVEEACIRPERRLRFKWEIVDPMKTTARQTTMSLGELIVEVYDRYGARHAEALVWFAIHGYLIVPAAIQPAAPAYRNN